MNQSIYRFTLDMQSPVSQATLSARRGDKSRFLSVTLTSGGVPYEIEHGCYAALGAKRASDDATLFGDCIIKDNSITYDMTSIVSSAEGRVDCDITLYSPDGEEITSPKFAVVVYAGATTGDEIVDTDEFRSLGEYVSAAEEAKESAEGFALNAAVSASEAAKSASEAVGGGVISFNGRNGEVKPQDGDYTAEMVGAEPAGKVGTHNADENAHDGVLSKEGHTHAVKDIDDFEEKTPRITCGTITVSSESTTLTLDFAPKFVAMMYVGGAEPCQIYAIKGAAYGCAMLQTPYSAEVDTGGELGSVYLETTQSIRIPLTWEGTSVIFSDTSTALVRGTYYYVAIG